MWSVDSPSVVFGDPAIQEATTDQLSACAMAAQMMRLILAADLSAKGSLVSNPGAVQKAILSAVAFARFHGEAKRVTPIRYRLS